MKYVSNIDELSSKEEGMAQEDPIEKKLWRVGEDGNESARALGKNYLDIDISQLTSL
jgi:hypothetical protein